MDTSNHTVPPLAKHLASTDKKTRDNAVKALSIFLSDTQCNALPELEMAKLWKAIFYCFWMSDKPLVQQALASDLAQLLLTITDASSSLSYLHGFWSAIIREWNGIDHLRMDKYYMLVRRFVSASFQLLIREGWAEDICVKNNEILTGSGGPLSSNDSHIPSSLTYHVTDIYLEELNKALGADKQAKPAPLPILISPFYNLAARTSSSVTYQRIEASVIIPLFRALSSSIEDTHSMSRLLSDVSYDVILHNVCGASLTGEGKHTLDRLKKALLKQMFDTASSPATKDSNRRRLYAIWKDIMAEDEPPGKMIFD